jgi:hypothetical protein
MAAKVRVYRSGPDPTLPPCWHWRHECRPHFATGGNGSLVPYEVGTWRAVMRAALQHVSECEV